MLDWEKELKPHWGYTPGETPPRQDSAQAKVEKKREDRLAKAIQRATEKAARKSKFAKNKVVSVGKKTLGGLEPGASAAPLDKAAN